MILIGPAMLVFPVVAAYRDQAHLSLSQDTEFVRGAIRGFIGVYIRALRQVKGQFMVVMGGKGRHHRHHFSRTHLHQTVTLVVPCPQHVVNHGVNSSNQVLVDAVLRSSRVFGDHDCGTLAA